MKIQCACVAAVLALTTGLAQAQFQKPEDAVKYRQSALSVMGTHFSRIGAMANGRVPFDAAAAQQNAAIVLTLSKLPWAGFTPDTEKIETKAKPALWREMDKVKTGADRLMASTVALDAAARTGNLDELKRAFGETAAACKACHDAYRN